MSLALPGQQPSMGQDAAAVGFALSPLCINEACVSAPVVAASPPRQPSAALADTAPIASEDLETSADSEEEMKKLVASLQSELQALRARLGFLESQKPAPRAAPQPVDIQEMSSKEMAVAQSHEETRSIWEACEKAAGKSSGMLRTLRILQMKDAEWRLEAELELEERRRGQIWELLRESFDNETFSTVARSFGGGHLDVARRIFGAGDAPASVRKASVPSLRRNLDGEQQTQRPARGSSASRPSLGMSAPSAHTPRARREGSDRDGPGASSDGQQRHGSSGAPFPGAPPAAPRQMRSSLPPKPTWMMPSSSPPKIAMGAGSEPIKRLHVREPSPSVQERVRAFESGTHGGA